MTRTAIVTALVAVLGALIAPASAFAAEDAPDGPQTWAIVPASAEGPDGRSELDYVVEPDDVYRDHIAVRNLGEQPLTLRLSAHDADAGSDGEFALQTEDEASTRIGAWVALDTSEVTVAPRSHVVVPFAMTVPGDAEPGDHAGGIVAMAEQAGQTGSTVQYRVGVRLHVRVAGPVQAALEVDTVSGRYEDRLGPFSLAPLDVEATVENTGNVRLTPQARVRVTGLFGLWSTSTTLDEVGELLPDAARTASARLEEVPPLGPLWVTVEITEVQSRGQDMTEAASVVSGVTVVWAVPWVLLGAVALLLIALALATRNLRRRRRAAKRARLEAALPPEGESRSSAPAPGSVAGSDKERVPV